MSQIFRARSERFNPQVHTEPLSLTVNMNKHMEVKNKTFELFAHKNKFISWLYATKRVNMGVRGGKVMAAREGIADNAYRVQYQGSLFTPAYSAGSAQIGTLYTADDDLITGVGADTIAYTGGVLVGTVGHDVVGSLAVKHDPVNGYDGSKWHEGDVIAPGTWKGSRFIVMGTPRKASSGDHYIVDFKVNSIAALYSEAHLADGELLSEAGNRFGEGSERGYQRERRSQWKINYSFISRATLTMTGSAQSQKVAWISNSSTGEKMWEFEAVLDLRERHAINLELGCRYARTSMDSSTHKWYEDYGSSLLTLTGFSADFGIVAPVIGDGWIAQLDDSFSVEYDPNADLPIDLIEMFMTVLAQRSPIGSTGNTFVALGDKLGHIVWDKSLKKLMGWTSKSADSASLLGTGSIDYGKPGAGSTIELGFEVDTYHYLKNKIVFIEDDLLNHPAFVPQSGGIIGDGTIYVLNATMVNGVSNIDLLARRDRDLRQKFVDGMHSLDGSKSKSGYAASGFDGSQLHLLSEMLPIIYSTESCGVIKPSAKYTGGALAGQPIATEDATKWYY